ncbi:MAG: hypothetical protein FGM46_00555 [Ferruginibacter sp.]|nr:hypothetical protein [Ferruginibacter sp.]
MSNITSNIFQTNDIDFLKSEECLRQLSQQINELILHDFEKVVQMLYRIDVSEQKLKNILKDRPDENAGDLIAALMIERQIQKILSRQSFKPTPSDQDEEEKW